MQCSVKSCNISDDRFLWKCEFCFKTYHAACVGVQRHQENFILSYMVPLCDDCQHNLKSGIDTRKVLHQQQQLIDTIKEQTDANLRVASDLKKLSAVGELFDNIELQLKETTACINKTTSSNLSNAVSSLSRLIENSPTTSKTDRSADELSAIKNHLTGLLNISMNSTKQHINDFVEDLTKDLTEEFKKICSEFQTLSSLTMDMASHCNEHNSSQPQIVSHALTELQSLASSVGGDILNEVKSLATVVNTLEANIGTARLIPKESPPNLLQELAETEAESESLQTSSGWRLLGSMKIWKADWTDYDARKRRRLNQQRLSEKAKAKKKRCQRRYAEQFKNDGKNDRNKTNKFTTPSPHIRVPHFIRTSNNKMTTQRSHFALRDDDNHSFNLPMDRELLAAAKERFSRPPPTLYRPIAFQRGEILNPYPASDRPTTSNTPNQSPMRLVGTCACQCFCQN